MFDGGYSLFQVLHSLLELLIGNTEQGTSFQRVLLEFSAHIRNLTVKNLLSFNDEFKFVMKVFDQHSRMALDLANFVIQNFRALLNRAD